MAGPQKVIIPSHDGDEDKLVTFTLDDALSALKELKDSDPAVYESVKKRLKTHIISKKVNASAGRFVKKIAEDPLGGYYWLDDKGVVWLQGATSRRPVKQGTLEDFMEKFHSGKYASRIKLIGGSTDDDVTEVSKEDLTWAFKFLRKWDEDVYTASRDVLSEYVLQARAGVKKKAPAKKAKKAPAKKKSPSSSKYAAVKKKATCREPGPMEKRYPAWIMALEGSQRTTAKSVWRHVMKEYGPTSICNRRPEVQWPIAVAIYKNACKKRGVPCFPKDVR